MKRSVTEQAKIEGTEDVLALLVRLGRDLERIDQAEEYKQRCMADARVTIGKTQRAVMTMAEYPYGREPEKVTA